METKLANLIAQSIGLLGAVIVLALILVEKLLIVMQRKPLQ